MLQRREQTNNWSTGELKDIIKLGKRVGVTGVTGDLEDRSNSSLEKQESEGVW